MIRKILIKIKIQCHCGGSRYGNMIYLRLEKFNQKNKYNVIYIMMLDKYMI